MQTKKKYMKTSNISQMAAGVVNFLAININDYPIIYSIEMLHGVDEHRIMKYRIFPINDTHTPHTKWVSTKIFPLLN